MLTAALLFACAPRVELPQSDQDGQYLVLRSESGTMDAKLTRDGMTGPTLQLTRYDNALRGRAFDATVDLFWHEGEVRGSVAGVLVDLVVEQEENVLTIRGLYRARHGTLTIQPGSIQGTVANCQYGLYSEGGTYLGQATCGGHLEQVTLSLPPMLLSFPPEAIAAHLVLFLGR